MARRSITAALDDYRANSHLHACMADRIEPQMGNAVSPHRILSKVKDDIMKLSVCDNLSPNACFLAHRTLRRRPKQLRLVVCADYAHPRDDTGIVSRLNGRKITD